MNKFFIIGAQRSGSTLLINRLDTHKNINTVKPHFPESKFFLKNQNIESSELFFKKYYLPGIKIVGEKATSYIESNFALKQIKNIYSDAKIIILLRDPVIRAHSNYLFSKSNNHEYRDFSEAFYISLENNIKSSVNPYDYKKRSHYLSYIENIYSTFDKKNILLLVFEEIICNKYLPKNIFEFLCVDYYKIKIDKVNAIDKVEILPKKLYNNLKKNFISEIEILDKKFGVNTKLWNYDSYDIKFYDT